VDKLERVLAAEEAARHAVAEARDRADAIRSEGRAHAQEIAARTSQAAVLKAAAERERIIGDARAAAAELTARADDQRCAALDRARRRTDAAVKAVVRALRD